MDLNLDEEHLKPYQKPYFYSPQTKEEKLAQLNSPDLDPLVHFFDERFTRNRELLIFMEETKIWQTLFQDCIDRSGVTSTRACEPLRIIVDERVKYYNSNFNSAMRPSLTPGVPLWYERTLTKKE